VRWSRTRTRDSSSRWPTRRSSSHDSLDWPTACSPLTASFASTNGGVGGRDRRRRAAGCRRDCGRGAGRRRARTGHSHGRIRRRRRRQRADCRCRCCSDAETTDTETIDSGPSTPMMASAVASSCISPVRCSRIGSRITGRCYEGRRSDPFERRVVIDVPRSADARKAPTSSRRRSRTSSSDRNGPSNGRRRGTSARAARSAYRSPARGRHARVLRRLLRIAAREFGRRRRRRPRNFAGSVLPARPARAANALRSRVRRKRTAGTSIGRVE